MPNYVRSAGYLYVRHCIAMAMDTQRGLEQKSDLVQRRRFTKSSLPLTMELASVLKAIILPHLINSPEGWPYHDRVLYWLIPSMGDDIQRFHGDSGPSITEMFTGGAVGHLDQDLLARLSALIEKVRPEIISLLQELSLVPREDDK